MGPKISEISVMKQIIKAGVNVVRFNCAHGDHSHHKALMDMTREASKQLGIPVAILLDTKGPEIRIGMIKDDGKVTLQTGKSITITTDDVPGTEELISVSYKKLHEDISVGKHIFIMDGIVDLEVISIEGNNIRCLIKSGGTLGSRKNVNVIGVKTSLPAMTEKDVRDITFGVQEKVDFIAASFIRRPSDVKEIRALLTKLGSNIHIISKIEDEEGIENIDEIIRVSDGVMVARGDLGVQLKTEEIPLVQKRIILKCNQQNKPVVTATQMLDSMITNPRPTRAESTDVANAIFDGTDAIMLSGETAVGAYPVEAVETMHNIALAVESSSEFLEKCHRFKSFENAPIAQALTKAAVVVSGEINADAILTPTLYGTTPKLLSKYRPAQTIVAATTSEEVLRRLLVYSGVYPILTEFTNDSDVMVNNALEEAMKQGYVKNFDKIVIVAGLPIQSPIMVNNLRIHIVCKVLTKGSRGFGKKSSGKVVMASNYEDAVKAIKGTGDEILVTNFITKEFVPLLPKLKGVLLAQFSEMTYDELTSINSTLVGVGGVSNISNILKDGQLITLDGEECLVYDGIYQK